MVIMRIPMTDRQKEVFDFIKSFIDKNKYPPSIRDIGKEFNITVKGSFDHIRAIEKKGWIKHIPNISRSIRII